MEPFKVADALKKLVDSYPDPTLLWKAAYDGGMSARIAIAQLWISEGIPHAFLKCPAIYDSVRTWLGERLDVHPKEISLTGSARFGKSIAPRKLGKVFDHKSDIDLFIVSSRLFGKLKDEFFRWSDDYEFGRIKPYRNKEFDLWPSNKTHVPKIISKGFIDTKYIPNRASYPVTKRIHNLMWLMVKKLQITDDAPSPEKASIRCYSSWESFVRQASLNLRDMSSEAIRENLIQARS